VVQENATGQVIVMGRRTMNRLEAVAKSHDDCVSGRHWRFLVSA